jgi:DNA-directed RNA polymerase
VTAAAQEALKDTTIYLEPTEELTKWITDNKAMVEVLCPLFLPMVCTAPPWTTPTTAATTTEAAAEAREVRNKGYQQELWHREMPAVYRAVNALQATPWKVNDAMLTVVREIWEAGLK